MRLSRRQPLAALVIARHALTLERFWPGQVDRNGDPVDAWRPPVTIMVYSIGPRGSDERGNVITLTGLTVGSPSSYGIGPKDRVGFKGKTWRVDGDVTDANLAPWTWRPGYVFYLEVSSG